MKTSKKFLAVLCASAGLAAHGTDSIVVDEGTYEPTSMSAGTNEIASLTVRSGAKLVIPAGVVIKPTALVVESGAIFGGAGRLLYPVSPSELAGLVLEDAVSIDDGRSGSGFSIEVLNGEKPAMAAQDGTLGIIILFGYTKNLSAYHFRYLKHNLGQTLRVILGINIFYIILLFSRCLSITNIIDIKAKGFGQVVKPVNFQLIFQSDLTPLIIIFYIKKLRYSSLCPVHPEKKQQLTTNEPLCCGTVENAASTVIADLGISPS